MFDIIADRYDLLNRLISLGVDQSWRRKTVDALALGAPPGSTERVLDLATGTADLALMVARRHPRVSVVGVDPSPKMLEVGERKIAAAGLTARVTLALGDAEHLGFEDASFDGVCMAFGIRNVIDRSAALREMARVTRPGRRVVILELSEPQSGIVGTLARFHIHAVVPALGAAISGRDEYSYLQRSIAAFPPAAEFARLIRKAGLDVISVLPLTFGVSHLYVATPRRGA